MNGTGFFGWVNCALAKLMSLFNNLNTEILSSVQSQTNYVLPLPGLGVCQCVAHFLSWLQSPPPAMLDALTALSPTLAPCWLATLADFLASQLLQNLLLLSMPGASAGKCMLSLLSPHFWRHVISAVQTCFRLSDMGLPYLASGLGGYNSELCPNFILLHPSVLWEG